MYKTIVILILPLVLLSASGCNTVAGVLTPSAPTAGPSAPRQEESIVSAEGIVVPAREVSLSFEVSGRVAEVPVKEGEKVEAGQVLARLDPTDWQQRIDEAQAAVNLAWAELERVRAGAREEEISAARSDLSAAQASLEVARAELAAAQAELARLLAGPKPEEISAAKATMMKAAEAMKLAQTEYDKIAWHQGIGATPQSLALQQATLDYEAAKAQYEALLRGATEEELDIARAAVRKAQAGIEVAQAQKEKAQARLALLEAGPSPQELDIARARLYQAQRTLKGAQTALDKTILRAPFAGTVGRVDVEVGEVVGGLAPGSAITLGDLSKLYVETKDLSEVDIAKVKIGQKAKVEIDALLDMEFSGQVFEIAPMSTTYLGDTVYTVRVALEAGQESGLRWGMTAYVDIIVGSR
ncbi:MAG: HlyD family secretion protein [Anaerolineae bacterium]